MGSQIVFDDRIMAIIVRLLPKEGADFETVNRVAHITVGTRDSSVKPKESNDLLARWLDGDAEGVHDVVLEERKTLAGVVKGVCNFHKK